MMIPLNKVLIGGIGSIISIYSIHIVSDTSSQSNKIKREYIDYMRGVGHL